MSQLTDCYTVTVTLKGCLRDMVTLRVNKPLYVAVNDDEGKITVNFHHKGRTQSPV